MKQPSIALCVIARDCAKEIPRLLNSTKQVFDYYCLQDTGSSNEDTIQAWVDWCEQHSKAYKIGQRKMGEGKEDYKFVEVNGKKILGDFGRARSDSFKLAKEFNADYAFWIDSDDVLVNAEVLPQIALEMKKNGVQMGLLTYVYAKGDGVIKPVVQKRERLIDLRVYGEWKNRVHESYQIKGNVRAMDFPTVYVQHERDAQHVSETGRRNNLIMTRQLQEDGLENFDDKMLHDLGFDHWEHKEYKEAIKYFKLFLQRHENDIEISFETGLRIARAYIEMDKIQKAIVWALKCMGYKKDRAEPYGLLAEIYDRIGNYTDAIYYADKVLQIGKPNTSAPINEADYTIIPLRIKIHALLSMGRLEDAYALMGEVVKISGDRGSFAELKGLEKELKSINTIKGIAQTVRYYQDNNRMKDLDRVLDAIPLELKDNPTIRQLIFEIQSDYRRKTQHIELNGKKTIVMYAGQQMIEPWNGESDIKKGIGGSEGMCIQLSRELAKLGNKVVVFNNCGDASGKTFDGVQYLDWRLWNSNLKCDVFVSLRRPDMFNQTMKAKKQYLWLHDTEYGDVPALCFNSPNKVIVLSNAHKEIIKQSHFITDDSIFWNTRNGINPLAVNYADQNAKKRNPYQIVYGSSYDRGLDFILENWAKIKKAVPQAELKIFYGWDTYNAMMQARQGTQQGENMFTFKQHIIDMITKLDGVTELGKLSQNEAYKTIKESSIWFYPTAFYEISCITAMSAQALGTIPICTPYGALIETVSNDYGIKLNREHIVDGLIYNLQHIEELEARREPISKWAREAFSMENLGKDWDNFFNHD